MGSNCGGRPDEEKPLLLLMNHNHDDQQQQQHPPPKPKKGGLRTIPFIIVNESFERLASMGLTPNMIFYLTNEYNLEVATASILLSLWSSLSNGLSIFGAILADSYLGRFRVIALGCFFSFLGMAMLWLTAVFPQLRPSPCEQTTIIKDICNHSPTAAQMAFLLSSFALVSIGAGCNRPCSQAFGLDQLDKPESYPNYAIPNNRTNERLVQSFINWYNIATTLSTLLALTIIVYIQDQFGWQLGFGVPAMLMLFSVLIFLMGYSFYIKAKANKSLFIGLFQVVVAAFKNRNIPLPPNYVHESADCYHQGHEPKLLAPTHNLRCLNKACIIKDPERDLKADGSASDPWSLCTVEQVESLKALLRVMPMWSTGILFVVSMYQGSFATLQAQSMDRHIFSNFEIPAGSFNAVMMISLIIWLSFYDRIMVPLLARYTGEPRGLTPEARMAISLLLPPIAMALSALVETTRRQKVREQGLEDDPHAKVDMSAMWLLPQYIMLGVADAFSATAQPEFFYIHLPKQMSSIAISLLSMELAAASLVTSVLVKVVDEVTSKLGSENISWLGSNINKGHVDYYYWLIACLGIVNFVYFLICLRAYGTSDLEGTSNLSDNVEEEGDQSHY